jgi:metal-responsive CopG/Arc/MetJ family transcriptional regulator
MKTNTVNISFQKDLLDSIDKVAREESRSRSELIREAARTYIDRKKKWKDIFAFGDRQVKKRGLTEKDIQDEIRLFRNLTK